MANLPAGIWLIDETSDQVLDAPTQTTEQNGVLGASYTKLLRCPTSW